MPTSSSSATERAQAARCRPTTSTLLRTAFVALRRIMHGEVVASAANASTVTSQAPLIASPTEWVHQLSAISGGTISHTSTRALYFNMLATLLTGAALVCNPSSAEQLEGCYAVFRAGSGAPTMKMKRTSTTMTGIKRLFNVRDLVIEVANKRLTGGILRPACGVAGTLSWRRQRCNSTASGLDQYTSATAFMGSLCRAKTRLAQGRAESISE